MHLKVIQNGQHHFTVLPKSVIFKKDSFEVVKFLFWAIAFFFLLISYWTYSIEPHHLNHYV